MENKVWDRFAVTLETLDATTVRLTGTGYVVRDRGGSTEQQIKVVRQGNYQKFLEEVATRLSPR
jgi:hypothetical protein